MALEWSNGAAVYANMKKYCRACVQTSMINSATKLNYFFWKQRNSFKVPKYRQAQAFSKQQIVQQGQLSSKSIQSAWNDGNVTLNVSQTAEGMVPEKSFEFN